MGLEARKTLRPGPRGHEPRDLFSPAQQHDFLACCDRVEQSAQIFPGVFDIDFAHVSPSVLFKCTLVLSCPSTVHIAEGGFANLLSYLTNELAERTVSLDDAGRLNSVRTRYRGNGSRAPS